MNYLETDKHIFFWKPIDKYGCFSQWYYNQLGRFKCAEQYMMYKKAVLFDDRESAKLIMKAETPKEMQEIGRAVKNFDQQKWDENKYDIVRTGNINKFRYNFQIRDVLLKTRDKILVEASPYDAIWGIKKRMEDNDIDDESTWKGENLLGKALVDARNYWRTHKTVIDIVKEAGFLYKNVDIEYRTFGPEPEKEDMFAGECHFDYEQRILVPHDGDSYSVYDDGVKYEASRNRITIWLESNWS